MSLQTARIAGNDSVVVQVAGDNVQVRIHESQPTLTLDNWKSRIDRKPKRDIDILNPASRAVPLLGRDDDLRFLKGWLKGQGIQATALVGPGGSGKTRLALELLQQLPPDWQGGFLNPKEARRFVNATNISDWRWQAPTLVVVDYAASVAPELKTLLTQLASAPTPEYPLRVLLIERHADPNIGWYSDLVGDSWEAENVREILEPYRPRKIESVDAPDVRRQILMAGILAATPFNESLPIPEIPAFGEDSWFDERLSAEQWSDPLLLLMAALSAFRDGIYSALNCPRPELAIRIAKREAQQISRTKPETNEKNLLAYFYACITLRGKVSISEAESLVLSELATSGADYDHVTDRAAARRAIGDLSYSLGEFDWIAPLTPDLLAEAFLLIQFEKQGTAVIERIAQSNPAYVSAVAVRTFQDFGQSNPLPLNWIRTLLRLAETNRDILGGIRSALPSETVVLMQIALDAALISTKSYKSHGGQPDSMEKYAAALVDLSSRQKSLGQKPAALASIEEAVALRRRLVRLDSVKHLPMLAGALTDLSNLQSETGATQDALLSIEEAVAIRSELAIQSPQFLPALALSLNNLSNRQNDLGQADSALATAQASTEIRAGLVDLNPSIFLPQYAARSAT